MFFSGGIKQEPHPGSQRAGPEAAQVNKKRRGNLKTLCLWEPSAQKLPSKPDKKHHWHSRPTSFVSPSFHCPLYLIIEISSHQTRRKTDAQTPVDLTWTYSLLRRHTCDWNSSFQNSSYPFSRYYHCLTESNQQHCAIAWPRPWKARFLFLFSSSPTPIKFFFLPCVYILLCALLRFYYQEVFCDGRTFLLVCNNFEMTFPFLINFFDLSIYYLLLQPRPFYYYYLLFSL